MRRSLSALAGVGLIACLVATSHAGGPDGPTCAGPGAVAPFTGGPAVGAAECGPQYVEQTVTAYRAETRTRVVPTVVNRVVCRVVEEAYTYTELVPVTTPQTQTQTYYTTLTRQVPYTYTELVPVTTPQRQVQTYYTTVTREVPYSYTAYVPVCTPQTRLQTYCVAVPEEVVRQVPVCRAVSEQVTDPCTGECKTVCRKVTELQEVRSVVSRLVPQTREVTVNVTTMQAQQRTGTRTVCESVPQTRTVTVNVTTLQAQQRTGTRQRVVQETVQETVNVTQTYCETVPYTYTVRVPVGGAFGEGAGAEWAAEGAGAGFCSGSSGGHGHRRRGH